MPTIVRPKSLLRPRFGWQYDEQNHLILFTLPPEVEQRTYYQEYDRSQRPSIINLPFELQLLIIDRLPPVDRVCLALTCKPLARTVLAAPALHSGNWSTFTSSANALHPPDWFYLLPRLAHGWIPRSTLRYCHKCHTIQPRSPAYCMARLIALLLPPTPGRFFPTRRTTTATVRSKPPWSPVLGIPAADYSALPAAKDVYTRLVDRWSANPLPDASIFCCDACMRAPGAPSMADVERGDMLCPMCAVRLAAGSAAFHQQRNMRYGGLISRWSEDIAQLGLSAFLCVAGTVMEKVEQGCASVGEWRQRFGKHRSCAWVWH